MTTRIWSDSAQEISDDALVTRAEGMTFLGRPAMDDRSLDLLATISRDILAAPQARAMPQYMALGYWLRPASLKRVKAEFEASSSNDDVVVAPRGVALHLPPTNVDTICVYSWAVSVLAGNCNIVRLPKSVAPGTEWLIGLIAAAIDRSGESDRQIFCTYDYGGDLEKRLSATIDLRMIWGGDSKVETVSRIPIRPDGLSLGFPDRKSFAVFETTAYRDAASAERDKLAQNFFNDVFWFDQMGCGSPRILFWVGDPGDLARDFFHRLYAVTEQKSHETPTGVAIAKLVHLHDLLGRDVGTHGYTVGNAVTVLETRDIPEALKETQGGGFLHTAVLPELDALAEYANRKLQTITHFGFSETELRCLARVISGRGGYRIVPVGRALQFDATWDGIALLSHATRRIRCEV